jgi:hypothetical protein
MGSAVDGDPYKEGGNRPATYEEEKAYALAHGQGVNGSDLSIGQTDALEVQRRIKIIMRGQGTDGGLGKRADGRGGFEDVKPDVADIAIRDAATGLLRRSRTGSGRSALGQAFDVTSPLGRDNIMGS